MTSCTCVCAIVNVFLLTAADSDKTHDDVVTVYKKADGTVARIDVSDKTVSGVITKIKDGAYTIGGETYGLNEKPKTEADELEKMMQGRQ